MTFLRGKPFWVQAVADQRRWIEQCEQNGRSYAGPRGQDIRQADENELRRCEQRLREFQFVESIAAKAGN